MWDVLIGFSLLANDPRVTVGQLVLSIKEVLIRIILSDNQLIMLCPEANTLMPLLDFPNQSGRGY